MKNMQIVVLLLALLLLTACRNSSTGASSSSSAPSTGASSSSSSSAPSTNASPLVVAKVQGAVDKALDWTRMGGNVTVLGIQEIPQENAARADIRFTDFQFNADSYGTPVDKNKKTPPEPDISDPKFYEKMTQNRVGQLHTERYSGQGTASLKKYNDGRWVLTGVQFGMNGTNANIEIR